MLKMRRRLPSSSLVFSPFFYSFFFFFLPLSNAFPDDRQNIDAFVIAKMKGCWVLCVACVCFVLMNAGPGHFAEVNHGARHADPQQNNDELMSTTDDLRDTTAAASPNSNANSNANSSPVCGGSGLSNVVKTAVVTTVRRPTKVMWNDFVCYHLSLGVDHIFVFFDDAGDAEAIESTKSFPPSRVTTWVQGPALRFILYSCFTHAFGSVTHALIML